MIKMVGRKMMITGKDHKIIKKHAKQMGMTIQNFVIGMLWEKIMKDARAKVYGGK